MLNFELKLIFAGLWDLIWIYGTGIGLIFILLAIEFFASEIDAALPILAPVITRFQKDLLYLAAIIAICLGVFTLGVHYANKRNEAKAAVTQTYISHAVNGARNRPRGLRDKFDTPDGS